LFYPTESTNWKHSFGIQCLQVLEERYINIPLPSSVIPEQNTKMLNSGRPEITSIISHPEMQALRKAYKTANKLPKYKLI